MKTIRFSVETKKHYISESDEYVEESKEIEYEPTPSQVDEVLVDVLFDKYFYKSSKNSNLTREAIRDFLMEADLFEQLAEVYEEDIAEYIEEEIRENM